MSMIAYVSIIVKNYNILEKTLKSMNYTINTLKLKTELVYLNLSGEYIGEVNDKNNKTICYLYKTNDNYRLVSTMEEVLGQYIGSDSQEEMQNRIDLIQQNYAAVEIEETARQNGWNTISREMVDGTIQIKLAV